MCGRFSCTLSKTGISKCMTSTEQGESKEPEWVKISKLAAEYTPCANICPGSYTPVLFSSKNLCPDSVVEKENDSMFLTEMKWGLIPSWHTGNEENFKFNMINCRGESLRAKASFRKPFESGQRCVVVAEGFYEWRLEGGRKQPYFVRPSDKQPLAMAALFDKWTKPGTREPLYSYAIVTVDASKSMKYVHNRMPAVLESSQKIRQWLTLPPSEAYKMITPVSFLRWHPVSTLVNNVKNKSPECLKELTKCPEKRPSSSKSLGSWLIKKSEMDADTESEPSSKKPRM